MVARRNDHDFGLPEGVDELCFALGRALGTGCRTFTLLVILSTLQGWVLWIFESRDQVNRQLVECFYIVFFYTKIIDMMQSTRMYMRASEKGKSCTQLSCHNTTLAYITVALSCWTVDASRLCLEVDQPRVQETAISVSEDN